MKLLSKINIIGILALILITNCDPKPQLIYIHNYSKHTIYYYLTCSDSLQESHKLVLFETIEKNDSTYVIAPNYRVPAYTYQPYGIQASWENFITNCPKKTLKVFFITEEIMEKYSWKEICQKQLYIKKIKISYNKLKTDDWVIKFAP